MHCAADAPSQFTGKQRDALPDGTPSGLDYFGRRYMSAAQGRFTSPDPVNAGAHLVNPQSWNAYAYVNNRPLSLVDPNGFEPVNAYAGTIHGFVGNMNATTHKVGLATGAAAGKALASFGETKCPVKPANVGPFTNSANRYVCTANGGWVDMLHFTFYAGRAYKYKLDGNADPVGAAMADGYRQERWDSIFIRYSAFSYEDLPSDLFGAEFGAQFFDPTSSLSLGQQLEIFMSYLYPMAPTSAPNYSQLPQTASTNPPIATNHTTDPTFTMWWNRLMFDQMERELTPSVTSTIHY
jgi:RHS repeat-associated protein